MELGKTATITAKGVILPNVKTLNVKVAEGSEFKVTLVDGNKAVDTCAYTVTDKGTQKEVNPGETVLTADNSNPNNSVELLFNAPATTYSGTYTGTVNFTVSVDDKSAS